MPLWLQHIVAFFRGGHGQIVNELDSASRRLSAHARYKQNVADKALDKAGSLHVKAGIAAGQSAKSWRAADKIAELIS